jgi:hypothetical protein
VPWNGFIPEGLIARQKGGERIVHLARLSCLDHRSIGRSIRTKIVNEVVTIDNAAVFVRNADAMGEGERSSASGGKRGYGAGTGSD